VSKVKFRQDLHGFTGFDRIYMVLQDFTGFYRIYRIYRIYRVLLKKA